MSKIEELEISILDILERINWRDDDFSNDYCFEIEKIKKLIQEIKNEKIWPKIPKYEDYLSDNELEEIKNESAKDREIKNIEETK